MNTMIFILPALALITAVIEWVAVGKRWRRMEYITKTGVMIFVVAWLVLSGSLQQINLIWFTLGAVFSLAGDIFLLRRNERLGFALGQVPFRSHISPISWH